MITSLTSDTLRQNSDTLQVLALFAVGDVYVAGPFRIGGVYAWLANGS